MAEKTQVAEAAGPEVMGACSVGFSQGLDQEAKLDYNSKGSL